MNKCIPLTEQVFSIQMTVSNMEKAVDFYCSVLSFEKISDQLLSGVSCEQLWGIPALRARLVQLRLGEEVIELVQFLNPVGRSIPKDTKSHDRWFQHVAIIVSDMEKAYQRLKQHHVKLISLEPQRLPDWNEKAGGIEALYFKDPDEHTLEILHFPSDKGDSKWHRITSQLFLGIDHTAIVVEDTQASLGFYRDLLGFEVVGQSENYGAEQERLNEVPGAHLLITTLKVKKGPSIELLHYLSPMTGRNIPSDTQVNDLWHGRIVIKTPDIDKLTGRLKKAKALFISHGVIPFSNKRVIFQKSCLVADPDGHAILLEERIKDSLPPSLGKSEHFDCTSSVINTKRHDFQKMDSIRVMPNKQCFG